MRRYCAASVADGGGCGRVIARRRIIVRRWRRNVCGGDNWLPFDECDQRCFVDQPLRTITGTNFFGRDLALDEFCSVRSAGIFRP